MRYVRLLIVLAAIAGIGYYGWSKTQGMEASRLAAREAARQKPEIEQCRQRLATLHAAWSAYRKDHRGGEPGRIEDLFPKYLKDGNLLVCPTVQRWAGRGGSAPGEITLDRRKYPVSYGFKWLTAGYARVVKKHGDSAPLIVCESHPEALYQAAYKKRAALGAFSAEQQGRWVGEVREARVLLLRRNGQIDAVDPSSEF